MVAKKLLALFLYIIQSHQSGSSLAPDCFLYDWIVFLPTIAKALAEAYEGRLSR